MPFELSSLQFAHAQNGHPPNFGPSGIHPTSAVASTKVGVEFIQFYVPDTVIQELNELNDLGDQLKPELTKSFNTISADRYEMNKQMQLSITGHIGGISFELVHKLDMLGNDVSDQHTMAIKSLYKLLSVIVKATLNLPEIPAVEVLREMFLKFLGECTACVHTFSHKIADEFKTENTEKERQLWRTLEIMLGILRFFFEFA